MTEPHKLIHMRPSPYMKVVTHEISPGLSLQIDMTDFMTFQDHQAQIDPVLSDADAIKRSIDTTTFETVEDLRRENVALNKALKSAQARLDALEAMVSKFAHYGANSEF